MTMYDLFAVIFVCGTVFTIFIVILSYKLQAHKRQPAVIDADLLARGFRRVVICWAPDPEAEGLVPRIAWRHVSELRDEDLWAAFSGEKDPS